MCYLIPPCDKLGVLSYHPCDKVGALINSINETYPDRIAVCEYSSSTQIQFTILSTGETSRLPGGLHSSKPRNHKTKVHLAGWSAPSSPRPPLGAFFVQGSIDCRKCATCVCTIRRESTGEENAEALSREKNEGPHRSWDGGG